MSEKGTIIADILLHAHLVRALPDGYDHFKATLQAMKNRDRAGIIRMAGTRYSNLPRRRGHNGCRDLPSKRFSRAKAAAEVVRNEVVAAVAGTPMAMAAAGAAARVEVVAARVEVATAEEEATAAPVVPAVVATATVADLVAAVGNATGGATSGRSAPRRRATSSPGVIGARVLPTRKPHAHRTRWYWRWSCRYHKRTAPGEPRGLWRREQASTVMVEE